MRCVQERSKAGLLDPGQAEAPSYLDSQYQIQRTMLQRCLPQRTFTGQLGQRYALKAGLLGPKLSRQVKSHHINVECIYIQGAAKASLLSPIADDSARKGRTYIMSRTTDCRIAQRVSVACCCFCTRCACLFIHQAALHCDFAVVVYFWRRASLALEICRASASSLTAQVKAIINPNTLTLVLQPWLAIPSKACILRARAAAQAQATRRRAQRYDPILGDQAGGRSNIVHHPQSTGVIPNSHSHSHKATSIHPIPAQPFQTHQACIKSQVSQAGIRWLGTVQLRLPLRQI
jgi:hypothetical protein